MVHCARIFALALLLVAGCSKTSDDAQEKPAKDSKTTGTAKVPKVGPDKTPVVAKANDAGQWYRAQLTAKDGPGDVAFFLQVPAAGAQGPAVLKNGSHDDAITATWAGEQLTVPFPLFHTKLVAKRAPDGTLTGSWTSESRTWGQASMAFAATPVPAPSVKALRGAGAAADKPAAVAGTWRVAMKDGPTKLVLKVAADGAADGWFTFPGGGQHHLGGYALGDAVRLTGFDGTSAYWFDTKLVAGKLQGTWAAGQNFSWKEEVVGERADQVAVKGGPNLISGETALEIEGVDLGKYRGKPLIVELAGSWCITCKFMAPFLVDMYEQYSGQGLQMLTLTYEYTDDADYNKKAADNFKRDYRITWDVVPMMGDLEEAGNILPSTLENMELGAFPFAIFIDKNGTVQQVHAGFPPEGSAEYKTVTAEYEAAIKALLAGS